MPVHESPMPRGRVDFACGTSNSILVLVSVISGGNYHNTCYAVVRDLTSHVLALEWLSPILFVAGQRNGTIVLYKLSFTKKPKPPVHAEPLGAWRHPGSIVKIVKVDEQRLLVTGMDNQVQYSPPPNFFVSFFMLNDTLNIKMHMYDIRTAPSVTDPKLLAIMTTVSTYNSNRQPPLTPIGKPYLSFPAYQNRFIRTLGLDIDIELGLIATGISPFITLMDSY
jgi:hypothetical protein